MTLPAKPVDLKKLLDLIEKTSDKSPSHDVLIQEFRMQAAHLREMDKQALRAQAVVTYLGQCFGFVIGMTAIICGSLTATYGSGLAGGFIGGGGVIGLVSVFVLGRMKPRPRIDPHPLDG